MLKFCGTTFVETAVYGFELQSSRSTIMRELK